MKSDLAPAIVFFGDKDHWKKGWDIAQAKWQAAGSKSIELQIASGQSHGSSTRILGKRSPSSPPGRFLVKHGLLSGEPTRTMPENGEKLVLGNSN